MMQLSELDSSSFLLAFSWWQNSPGEFTQSLKVNQDLVEKT
jgi:hypothetical protein